MAEPVPLVSVAVSTYQRAQLLPRLVAALEQQTLPLDRFEVVIADNGTTDITADVLHRLCEDSRLDLRVVRARVNRGPAAGRNLAWRAARAEVVAFTDDDCVPTPGWLEAGLAALGGGADVAVGRTVPAPGQLHMLARPFSRSVNVSSVRFFETCNVFYRRADLEAVGGFDEEYGGVGGEDTDLALRLLKATGGTAVFADEALVHHDVRPLSFSDAVRETFRWTDIPLLVKRHPEARRLFHRRLFWRPAHPATLAALAGLVLGVAVHPSGLGLLVPWVWHRTVRDPVCPGPRRRWLVLPAAFLIDVLEIGVMLRGSVRHRVVLV